MKSTRKSRRGWTALILSLAFMVPAAMTYAQPPEFDPQTGSARISGGNPYADYRSGPGAGADPSVYQNFAPYPAYGGGWAPPQGVKLDPAFRAAAGLGGPSLAELDRIRLNIYSAQGDIAGVDRGFTNIGAFIPRRVFSDYNLFAFNPRLLVDNNGQSGFNLGAIHRFYVPSLDRVFGHSYWWDYSRSYGDEIQGFGWSFESIGKYLSLRLNANVNVGESQKIFGQQVFGPQLSGHNIVLPVLESFEAPVDNYSFEVATPVPYLGKYGAEWGVGGYILTASGVEDTLGVSGRAQWQVTEDLAVNTLITNDDLFDTNVSFNIELQIPDGRPSRIARPNPVVMSLTQSVQRNYQIKVARGQRTKYYSEIDPKDNLPIGVAVIDPNATQAGNGSAQLPFQSFEQYMAVDAATRAGFDFILVQPNTNASDRNLNTGITITSTQHLIGNGFANGVPRPTYTSTLGTFFLPGIVEGTKPRISNTANPGGNVVTLAGNVTEVSNFTIFGGNTNHGIVSAGAIDGFNIHDNTITRVVDAVRIVSNTGPVLNCPGENVGIIERNVLRGVSGVGNLAASVTHTAGTLDLRIADNDLDPFDNAGIEVIASGPRAIVNAVGAGEDPEFGILRNTMVQMGTGIRLRAEDGGQLLADVQDNSVRRSSSGTGSGLEVIAVDPGSTVVLNTLEDNLFTLGSGQGASLSASGGATIIGANPFVRNQFTNNLRDGMNVAVTGAGSAVILQGIGDTILANANTFSNNGDDGLEAVVNGGGQFVVLDPIVRQTFSNNGDHGFRAFGNGLGSLLAFNLGDPAGVLGNTFSNNGATTGTGTGATIQVLNGAAFTGGVFNNLFTGNTGAGLAYSLANVDLDVLNIVGNTVQNSGAGIVLQTSASTFGTINVANNLAEGSTAGDGFLFSAQNSAVNNLRIFRNGFRGNSRHGINLDLDATPIFQLDIVNNQGGIDQIAGNLIFNWTNLIFTNLATNTSTAGLDIASFTIDITNAGQGYRPDITPFTSGQFQPVGNSDVTTGLTAVNGIGITAGTTPLQDATGVFLPQGGVPVGSQVITLDFNDFNSGETLNYLLSHSFPNSNNQELGSTLAGSTGTVTLEDGRTASGVLTAGGLAINQALTQRLAGLSSNGANGVLVNAQNGSHITRMNIRNNSIDDNGAHGVEIVAEGSRLPGNNRAIDVARNSITGNRGDGLRMLNPHTGNVPVRLQVQGNDISNNTGAGVNVAIDQSTYLHLAARVNNVTNNGSWGLGLTAIDDSRFNLVVGDPNIGGNLYDGNGDVGIGVLTDDNAGGRFNVTNSTITNTAFNNTPFSPFNGDGVALVTRGNSFISGSVTNSTITNNAGGGIFGSATGNNLNLFSQILAFDIGNNLIEGNGANPLAPNRSGIVFIRTANGRIGPQSPINIHNNTIRSNPFDGIQLSSRQSFTTDFYVIQDNLITLNSEAGLQNFSAGIHLDSQADAQLRANILRNQIVNNVFDGILTTDDINFPTDQRSVGGNWFQNTITGNGGNGINLLGAVNDLFIGSDTDDTLGNLIANNDLDGVNNLSAGTWSLANNVIQLNGGHGVDIGGVGFKDVRVIHNHILQNGTAAGEPGDGIEFNNNSQFIFFTALGNVIEFNEGRGIDILNQDEGLSTIVIGTDTVSGQQTVINTNGGEGIYVVNTASDTQNQSAVTPQQGFANSTDQPVGATHKGMNTDGNVTDGAFLNISIDDALVIANGQDDTVTDFQATGIVFRVGTTGGGYDFTDPGGFAADIIFGGVVASLTNTTMGGNFGDDLFFESFTSTVDPNTTNGTWDNTQFSGVNNYQGDPLARLDLTYRNNIFLENPTLDPLVVVPALVTAQGAYYDNAEGTFKSRQNNIVAPNIPGPFASATRRRNAQRQALRVYGDGTNLPPNSPVGSFFLFPGVGDSTFRIDTLNSDPLLTLQSVGFEFDLNSPLFSIGDAQGVFYPIGGNTQSPLLGPWGWGQF